ncbi:MAG: MFS transporter [Pseudomonadota bacterium]
MSSAGQPVGAWFQNMPVTRRHWQAGLVLFMAFVIESWEMMIIIYSSSAIAAEFGLSTAQVGSLIGAIFLGMIPGALIWGKLAGPLGRRRCLMLSFGIYALFPLASAFAPGFEVLWALRFLGGVALAGALVITFPFFTELVPVPVRGRATVFLSAGWPVGVLIALGVTSLLLDLGWRWVLAMGSFAGVWTAVIYWGVPESPYWLAEKGRKDAAAAAITRLSDGHTRPMLGDESDNAAGQMPFFKIFARDNLRITLTQTVVNFCFSWGYWGLASWMPSLLARRGLSTPEGLGFIALSALFMFPGYLTASYVTGRIGRRRTMLIFVAAAAVAGIGFAYSQTLSQMYAWNFALSFFMLGGWGVWNTWLSEIYATPQRSAGVGWGVAAQRVANTLAPIVIGAMLASSTFGATVAFITAFLGITFVACLFLPETEGQRLG